MSFSFLYLLFYFLFFFLFSFLFYFFFYVLFFILYFSCQAEFPSAVELSLLGYTSVIHADMPINLNHNRRTVRLIGALLFYAVLLWISSKLQVDLASPSNIFLTCR
jgi:hypothetical protein